MARKKTDEPSKKMGRPKGSFKSQLYTPELGEAICFALAEGETLKQICAAENMPARGTVHRWLVSQDEKLKAFQDAHRVARAAGAFIHADEILEISDDGSLDMKTVVGQDGQEREVVDYEHIQRSKLRVDSRKFLMSKFAPEIFGDRVNVAGVKDAPIETKETGEGLINRDVLRRIAFILAGKAITKTP